MAAWTPVVTDIIKGSTEFEDAALEQYLGVTYPLIVGLLSKELGGDMRIAVRDYLIRVGEVKGLTTLTKAADA